MDLRSDHVQGEDEKYDIALHTDWKKGLQVADSIAAIASISVLV